MITFNGSLGGRPWQGWVADRPEDLPSFLRWAKRQTGTVAVDVEGKGLAILSSGSDYLRHVQFGTEDEAWAVPIELGPQFKAAAREALEALPAVTGHQFVNFDAPGLAVSLGLDFNELASKTTDGLILSKLIDPRGAKEGVHHGLKPLSERFVASDAPDTQAGLKAVFHDIGATIDTGWSLIDLLHPTYLRYALLDVILSSRLLPALEKEARRVGVRQSLVPYEHAVARICAGMSLRGFLMDRPYTERLSADLQREAEENSRVAARYGVEKIGSPKQVADALLGMGETMILPGKSSPEMTDGGQIKVDKDMLHWLCDLNKKGERIGHHTPNPLAEAVLKAKRAAKWDKTYAQKFLDIADENDRVHPNFSTLAARTGRMSVRDPAVQTLPSKEWRIRRALIADPGEVIISTDFDSVELNVIAALADVKEMKSAIARKEKLHVTTAKLVFGDNYSEFEYSIAKMGNFLKVYGGGLDAAIKQTGADPAVLKVFFDRFNRAYKEIPQYGRRLQREAFDNGMVVRSLTGRILPLDRDRTYAAVNYVTQSTARDCLGQALINAEKEGVAQFLRLAVHDEMVASVPKSDEKDAHEAFRRSMNFSLKGVPITATPETYGPSWGHGYASPELIASGALS